MINLLSSAVASRFFAICFVCISMATTAAQLPGVGPVPPIRHNGARHIPRKILILYSDKENNVYESAALKLAAMPLDYMGYVPIFYNVAKSLPAPVSHQQYQGIVVWVNNDYLVSPRLFEQWLANEVKKKVPIAILGDFGFPLNSSVNSAFDLKANSISGLPKNLHISKTSSMIGYEAKPRPNPLEFTPLTITKGKVYLQVMTGSKQTSDVVAITPWGGYALDPYFLLTFPNDQNRWVINPFEFLKKALRLQTMPVPDVTTENGRRLMLVHIDGDAFISRSEWVNGAYAGETLLKTILERYKIPTTVSIIEGEISDRGLYPKASKKLEAIARKIFALPWVEIASHSFSHPYQWRKIEAGKKIGGYNLPIKNYHFNLKEEITGSVNYIDNHLAPPGKKCKVFLWTGDTNPSAAAVAMTYHDAIYNMNGGDTTITKSTPSITNIAPLGVYKEKYFQVFAPNQNENVYTNNWTHPFYAYEKVIQTFELTNKPIRTKPIDIYYHFYTATKQAALQALEKIYQWALKQPVMNIYVSQYVKKVLDFNSIQMAHKGNRWIIHSHGNLREFRSPKSLGYPDLSSSKNVIGYSPYGKDYYIHLGPAKSSVITLSNVPSVSLPYLKTANARVVYFKRQGNDVTFKLQGHLSIKFTLANMQHCKVQDGNNVVGNGKSIQTFMIKATQTDALKIICQK